MDMPDRHRILLVEDSPDCQLLVKHSLQDDAQVTVASDLRTACDLLKSEEFDLLLLDIGLPDGDGFGLCSSILAERGLNRPRVVFLTGSAKVSDKLTGFSVGGDDYLLKPFEPLELKARVRAHLRNRKEIVEAANRVRVGNLEMNLVDYTIEVQTSSGVIRPDLTPTEFRLLYRLAKNEGRVLSREQLLTTLSEEGLNSSDRTIDAHLSRVRKKLTGCSHSIEAIYGVGYRLIRIQEGKS